MFIKKVSVILSLIVSIDCQLSQVPIPVLKPINISPNNNDLIQMNNRLALELLKTFPTDGNNFFSPLSITTALLMVMNGANGATQEEFRKFFKLNDQGD